MFTQQAIAIKPADVADAARYDVSPPATASALQVNHGLFEDQPAFTSFRSITLQGPVDLDGFRRAARSLMAQQIRPEWVSWHSSDDSMHDLFSGANKAAAGSLAGAAALDAPGTPVVSRLVDRSVCYETNS